MNVFCPRQHLFIFSTLVSQVFATERHRKTTRMTQTASFCLSGSLNMFVGRRWHTMCSVENTGCKQSLLHSWWKQKNKNQNRCSRTRDLFFFFKTPCLYYPQCNMAAQRWWTVSLCGVEATLTPRNRFWCADLWTFMVCRGWISPVFIHAARDDPDVQ